jgi:hypothetical protein
LRNHAVSASLPPKTTYQNAIDDAKSSAAVLVSTHLAEIEACYGPGATSAGSRAAGMF